MENEGSLLSFRRIYYHDKLNSCNYTILIALSAEVASSRYDTGRTGMESFYSSYWTMERSRCSYLLFLRWSIDPSLLSERMMHLAALPQVSRFPVRLTFLFRLNTGLMRFVWLHCDKWIRLWASFHPEMTDENLRIRFISLMQEYRLCQTLKSLPSRFTESLLPDIYFSLMLYRVKGTIKSGRYSVFRQLDNLFEYDLKNAPVQWEVCAGGRNNCFIDWKGYMLVPEAG